jgi:hypothetical protein
MIQQRSVEVDHSDREDRLREAVAFLYDSICHSHESGDARRCGRCEKCRFVMRNAAYLDIDTLAKRDTFQDFAARIGRYHGADDAMTKCASGCGFLATRRCSDCGEVFCMRHCRRRDGTFSCGCRRMR